MTSKREEIARAMFRDFVSAKPAAWLTLSEGARNHWLAFADSALTALAEPDEGMRLSDDPREQERYDAIFEAMIAKAREG